MRGRVVALLHRRASALYASGKRRIPALLPTLVGGLSALVVAHERRYYGFLASLERRLPAPLPRGVLPPVRSIARSAAFVGSGLGVFVGCLLGVAALVGPG